MIGAHEKSLQDEKSPNARVIAIFLPTLVECTF